MTLNLGKCYHRDLRDLVEVVDVEGGQRKFLTDDYRFDEALERIAQPQRPANV